MDPLALMERWKDQEEGATFAGLAEAIGVRPRYLSDVRRGRHRLSPDAARRLAAVLKRARLLKSSDIVSFQLACRNMPLCVLHPPPDLSYLGHKRHWHRPQGK